MRSSAGYQTCDLAGDRSGWLSPRRRSSRTGSCILQAQLQGRQLNAREAERENQHDGGHDGRELCRHAAVIRLPAPNPRR